MAKKPQSTSSIKTTKADSAAAKPVAAKTEAAKPAADAAAASLRTQAEYLLQYTSARATVEGHADERGTREYNLALGDRRATAAKNYLVSLGVPENRVSTVSYGEERPIATASNEAAWARNRRAVTVMITR